MKSDVDSSGRIVIRFTRLEAEKLHRILLEASQYGSNLFLFAGRHFSSQLMNALSKRIGELHQSLRMRSAARALGMPYSKKTAKSAAVAYRRAFPVAGEYKAKARGKRA